MDRRGAKLLGDFASYLISSEILLCPAPPSHSFCSSKRPLFFDDSPPGAFSRDFLYDLQRTMCLSLSLSSFCSLLWRSNLLFSLWLSLHGHLLARIPLRSHGKSARSCRSDGEIFTLSLGQIRIETCLLSKGKRRIASFSPLLIDLSDLYSYICEEKTLIGDVFENENERIEEEVGENRQGWIVVCVYIYIYRALEQEKRTDSPWESGQPFPIVRTTAIFDLDEKASKAYQSLTR